MKYITCSVAVAPLRKEAAHCSEMVSQLLAGESAEVMETGNQFLRVRCLYDNYEGWCAVNQCAWIESPPPPVTGDTPFEPALIREAAMEYLDVPYLWGGHSRCGIDCSGFSQQVMRGFGIALPRDAWQQAGTGEVVGFLQEVQCGDLAFFDNEEGKITHVGIMLGPGEIIHAAGKVRLDPIDHQGIVNADTGLRTHRLRIIRRYKKP